MNEYQKTLFDFMYSLPLNDQLKDEFFVGTYSSRDRKYINKLLETNYKEYLAIKDSYYFEENVLYDFVESGSDDFEDFLE